MLHVFFKRRAIISVALDEADLFGQFPTFTPVEAGYIMSLLQQEIYYAAADISSPTYDNDLHSAFSSDLFLPIG
jgi:hypothetical protein